MAGRLTVADWAGLVGVQVALILGLGSWMLFLQSRTDNRLDRIEDRMGSLEQRMARVEERLGSLERRVSRIETLIERSSPFAAGKHATPEGK